MHADLFRENYLFIFSPLEMVGLQMKTCQVPAGLILKLKPTYSTAEASADSGPHFIKD